MLTNVGALIDALSQYPRGKEVRVECEASENAGERVSGVSLLSEVSEGYTLPEQDDPVCIWVDNQKG